MYCFSLSSNNVNCMILVFLLIPPLVNCEVAEKKTSRVVPALFVFGDSVLDTGNNNWLETPIKCNFPPYGQDFAGHTATGRFSNGRVQTDFIASKLGLKATLPAYTNVARKEYPTGVSFASGGSGYDLATSLITGVNPFPKQFEMFKDYKKKLKSMVGRKRSRSIISDSLYIVSSGTNDMTFYFITHPIKDQNDMASYANFLVKSSCNITMELVRNGARHIGVFGVPALGCIPFHRNLSGGLLRKCAKDLNEFAKLYNSKLSRELQMLSSSLKGTKLGYIDLYTFHLDIVQRPQIYGFKEVMKGCCADGTIETGILCNQSSKTCKNVSNHVYWDGVHPTERTNQIIVDNIYDKYIKNLF